VNLTFYAVGAALIALGWLLAYFRLRARLAREIEARDPAAEVREELQSIMVEINRTTEQNVAILEDKIEQLSALMKEADRKIGLLRRETEKNEVSRQVYTRVFRAPPASATETDGPRQRPEAGTARPEGTDSKSGSGAPAGAPPEAASGAQSGARSEALPVTPSGTRSASSPEPGPSAEGTVESLEARILRLAREGFSPEMIAGRVGSTASEVQLIISLAGRRR
jgi:hypothetical protein